MFDEDDSPSPSSAEYLTSPHEAKRKALMQKLEKQGLASQVKPGSDLKQLKLTLLKGQVEKKDDNAQQREPEKAGAKQGTKTREQEIAAQKLTADTQPNAEQSARQGLQDKKATEALKADEVQSEDA